MSELLKGRKADSMTAELIERMERLRLEIEERRLRRVRLIQSLHC